MKIAIDISAVVYGTGVSVYTKELVTNLLKIDKENEYLLYGASLRKMKQLKNFVVPLLSKNVSGKIVPLPPTLADIVWNKMHVTPIEQIIGKVDVFHSSDWTQPPTAAYRVTTVHDLVPILYPQWSHPKIISVHTKRLEHVKREIDAIIVPSKQTKDDLSQLGVKGKKVNVIYESTTPFIKKANATEINRVKKKYKLNEYLFSIGLSPRKNTNRLIKAFNLVSKEFPHLQLVFAGNSSDTYEDTHAVSFLGYIPDEDLSGLYSGSKAVVYPSLYEGFGIPILDGFKCGVPVVTSNRGSMKEVASSAAVLVDPENVNDIARGIKEGLLSYKKYIRQGEKHVKSFSWEKMARQTLALYEKAK